VSDAITILSIQGLRGTDSNTLLRLHDQASRVAGTAASQQERDRADRAVRRIAAELLRRKVAW
jgi:hypothetical protein